MELKTNKWFYILTAIAGGFIMILGSWWLYLVLKLGHQLERANLVPYNQLKLITMVKWEGATFLIVFISFLIALIYFFIQDKKKTWSMQSFYASMTHELKTPIASINLQADFIADLLQDNSLNIEQLKKLILRIKQDVHKLENQVDRSLQLARVEAGGQLNLCPINIEQYLNQYKKKYPHIKLNIKVEKDFEIQADEFALSLIFKNLFENTFNHNANFQEIAIWTEKQLNFLHINYSDNSRFTGNLNKLGELFYKFNSPKGSGIGLYLINKLMKSMNGHLVIKNNPLVFSLIFPIGTNP